MLLVDINSRKSICDGFPKMWSRYLLYGEGQGRVQYYVFAWPLKLLSFKFNQVGCLSVWLTDWLSVSLPLCPVCYLKMFLPYSTSLIAERQHLSWLPLCPHPCPCPFSFSKEEWPTNLSCWKNLWNISLKEQYALESSQEVQWHELDDLWKNRNIQPHQ